MEANPPGTDIRSQWGAATSKEVSRWQSGRVGRPWWSADCRPAPNRPIFGIWAVLVSLVLIPWVMACPKLVCFGAQASFDPLKPGQRTLIDYLLPWIEECVFIALEVCFLPYFT